ncbi:MAG: hypothetical protein RL522_930 [Pseudomonadota bacterium]|jgi:hypothetical protein
MGDHEALGQSRLDSLYVIADPAFDSVDSALRELESLLGLPPAPAVSDTGLLLRSSDAQSKP